MKDYNFADKFIYLRKANDLSQKEIAAMLGVSNKAISKWENADALPPVKQIMAISNIFNVSIDDLLKTSEKKQKEIYKIVLTGGPCAGKTSALKAIKERFSKLGFFVIFIQESATEIINSGLAPYFISPYEEFQFAIMRMQIQKEEIYENLARSVDNYDKFLIVCDRGTMDGKAYMNKMEFDKCLKLLNTNEVKLRDRYDAVFHLTTSAIGAEEYYNHDNEARQETLEEAIEIDKKIVNAWNGHPHLRIIDNTTNFEDKIKRLLFEIESLVSQPFEIERKFLIKMPNLDNLIKNYNCKKIEISQNYLKTHDDIEERIRQRGENGVFEYTKTAKKKISSIKRIETEQRLTKDEYLKLLLECDTNRQQIIKTRYCLVYNNQYFEIDVFPFWKDQAIMEIELNSENQKIDFPKFINIIKEVTDDENYFNSKIAQNLKNK